MQLSKRHDRDDGLVGKGSKWTVLLARDQNGRIKKASHSSSIVVLEEAVLPSLGRAWVGLQGEHFFIG